MSYTKWFQAQGERHRNVVEKLLLKNFSKDEIIEYFAFENMVKDEPDFCPLYADNRKCHDYEALNCYLCACPNFRFSDEGIAKEDDKTLFSTCSIDSKDGKRFIGEGAIHQDCSGCIVPHREKYIEEHFHKDWFEIMQKCKV